MHPVLFSFGGLTIHWYGVMMALGMMAGMLSWAWVGRRENRSLNFSSDLLFWIVIAAVLGARAAYIASEWEYFMDHPHMLHRVDQGGLIYYGGMIAATGAVFLFAKIKKEPVLALYDFVATSLPLAHAFGRVGCFLNGCCHGSVCSDGLCVRYPAQSFAWSHQLHEKLLTGAETRSLPVHPVQLYEAGLAIGIYILLLVVHRKRRRSGMTTAAYLMLYPTVRFFLEFLRGDERERLAVFTVAQTVSLALFLCGLTLFAVVRLRNGRPAPARPTARDDSAHTRGAPDRNDP